MKNAKWSAAMLLALAMSYRSDIILFDKGITPKRKTLTDKEKERIAKQYASEQHEYTIKGVKIVAPNKKTAIKKYNLENGKI